jgi:hypothetical protein
MSVGALTLLAASAVAADLPDRFHEAFRGPGPPPAFQLVGADAEQYVRPEAEGLRITVPPDRKDLGPVGVRTKFAVRGDFEITAGYEVLKADEPSSGWGVGVTLWIRKPEPSVGAATLGWVLRPREGEVAVWDRAMPGSDEKNKVRYEGGAAPSNARTGRLRFARTGSKLHYLVAGPGEDAFREVAAVEFGTEDIQTVRVAATSGREPYGVDVRLSDLDIRATQLPDMASHPRTGTTIAWLVAGGLVVAVGALALGFLWRLRWRRQRPGPRKDAVGGTSGGGPEPRRKPKGA